MWHGYKVMNSTPARRCLGAWRVVLLGMSCLLGASHGVSASAAPEVLEAWLYDASHEAPTETVIQELDRWIWDEAQGSYAQRMHVEDWFDRLRDFSGMRRLLPWIQRHLHRLNSQDPRTVDEVEEAYAWERRLLLAELLTVAVNGDSRLQGELLAGGGLSHGEQQAIQMIWNLPSRGLCVAECGMRCI